MSNLNNRKIGLLDKNYDYIVKALSKKIGVSGFGGDMWGLRCGAIVDPYYAEYSIGQWATNRQRHSADDYMDFIRKVVTDTPNFDNKFNLSNEELSINQGTMSEFPMGNTLSSVLNRIQSFVGKESNGYGSVYSRLYSMHSATDEVGVIRNYNMNAPKKNVDDKQDTLMSNMAVVHRGKMFMDGMLRWGREGNFANYSPISTRMGQYFFLEQNYGFGLDRNFGNGNEPNNARAYIQYINSPLDFKCEDGLMSVSTLYAYEEYFQDLGDLSKYYYYNTHINMFDRTKEAKPLMLNVKPTDVYFPEVLGDGLVFYPINRKTVLSGSDNALSMNASVIYNKFKQEYEFKRTRFVVDENFNDTVHSNASYHYAEMDAKFNYGVDGSLSNFDKRVAVINESHEVIDNQDDEDFVIVSKENGQANGVNKAYSDSSDLNYKDLIALTNEAFKQGTYNSLSSRFHTSNDDGKLAQETQTAVSSQFGLSRGRNLLKADVNALNPTYTNNYENPYCRVWTYHHQYHTLKNTMRCGEQWGKAQLFRDEDGAFFGFRSHGDDFREGFINGQESLNRFSVLRGNGLVNITPKYNDEEFDITRCMFSIENLAWRDNMRNVCGNKSKVNPLGNSQEGPLGGRIMWFPPYGLSFSENSNPNWSSVGNFIGRGEDLKAYTNTTRSGTLSFIILVDHPSILDFLDKDNKRLHDDILIGNKEEGVDDTGSTEQSILRFFAGCDVLTPNKLEQEEPIPNETLVEDPPIIEEEEKPKKKEVAHEMSFVVFFPNNYSGIDETDPSEAMFYLANGIGTSQYINITDSNIEKRNINSLSSVKFESNLETKYTLVNPRSEETLVKHWTDVSEDPYSFIDGFNYENCSVSDTVQILHGYEMDKDESGLHNGISYVSHRLQRYFYPPTTDSSLSGNVTPIFLCAKLNNEDQIYYISTIDADIKSTSLAESGAWLYRVDHTSYVNPQGQERKHYQEKMYNRGDYADRESFGLNGISGMKEVSSEYFNSYSNLSGSTWVDETGNKRLVSFADFIVACYMLSNQTEDVSKINLREGIEFDIDNVKAIKQVLSEQIGTIEVRGISNYHGVPQGTTDAEKGANFMLARHRAEVIANFLNNTIPNGGYDISYTTTPNAETNDNSKSSVNNLLPKLHRASVVTIKYSTWNFDDTTENVSGSETQLEVTDDGSTKIIESGDNLNATQMFNGDIPHSKRFGDNTSANEVVANETKEEKLRYPTHRYEDEYEFFRKIEEDAPFLRDKIREKIKYFDPAYHSISPEGFNARLTFLHQCTRQGPTIDISNSANASNLAFGRPPICVLRLGDFWYSRIIINSLSINYDNELWDMNNEGIGMQPMMAKVSISFDFLGGQDLGGPIQRLQNAVSFNYYANTRVYDDRAEQISYTDSKNPYEFNFIPNDYQ